MDRNTLLKKLEELPEEAQNQALQYIDQLYQKYHTAASKQHLSFGWRGGLKNIEESSIDLQHKANSWR